MDSGVPKTFRRFGRAARITCLLLGVGLACATAQAQEVRWAVRVHPGVLAGLTLADLSPGGLSPEQTVDRLKGPDFARQAGKFLDLCVKKRISEVILDGFQPELKGLYFRSPELESLGWVPLVDVLSTLRAAASARSIDVGLNVSELGVHAQGLYEKEYGLDQVRPLPLARLGQFLQALAETYHPRTITEAAFPAAWFSPVFTEASRLDIRYLHRTSADDIVTLTAEGERTTPIDAFPAAISLSTIDSTPLIAPGDEGAVTNGSLSVMLRARPAVEVTDAAKGPLFLESAILFRAVQAGTKEFTVAGDAASLERISSELLKRVEELGREYDDSAPRLDIVVLGKPKERLDAAHVGWLQLAANLEPAVLGFGAAGFRVSLTDQVRPDARAYYIYLAGNSAQQWKQAESGLAKASPEKPILIQFGSEPGADVLAAVGRFLGLNEPAWVNGIIPPVAVYRNQTLNFKGPDLYQGKLPTGYVQYKVDPAQVIVADVLGQGMMCQNREFPNRFFVNSNLVHRDLAFPLSNVLTARRGLQRPAACFIAVGKRTAFWALADTEVEWINPRTGARLVLEMKQNGFYVE